MNKKKFKKLEKKIAGAFRISIKNLLYGLSIALFSVFFTISLINFFDEKSKVFDKSSSYEEINKEISRRQCIMSEKCENYSKINPKYALWKAESNSVISLYTSSYYWQLLENINGFGEAENKLVSDKILIDYQKWLIENPNPLYSSDFDLNKHFPATK